MVADLRSLTRADFAGLRWHEHADSPVIGPPALSPIIADPAVLAPADSQDGRWHLFAHSLRGIHHHVSLDGVRWRRLAGVAIRGGMRPHLTVTGGRYLMAYERPQVFVPVGLPWRSRIEARWSDDLLTWGEPAVLLEPSLRWHERGRSRSVGNPCLVRSGGGWRLWYSAGLVRLPDCGFDEPAWTARPTPTGRTAAFAPIPTRPSAPTAATRLGISRPGR